MRTAISAVAVFAILGLGGCATFQEPLEEFSDIMDDISGDTRSIFRDFGRTARDATRIVGQVQEEAPKRACIGLVHQAPGYILYPYIIGVGEEKHRLARPGETTTFWIEKAWFGEDRAEVDLVVELYRLELEEVGRTEDDKNVKEVLVPPGLEEDIRIRFERGDRSCLTYKVATDRPGRYPKLRRVR